MSVHELALHESPVLRSLCTGGFLEAQTGRIELKDDDPEIFGKVLGYLYRGDYEPYDLQASRSSEENPLYAESAVLRDPTELDDKRAMDSAMVYIMADKYQLDGLKKVAVDKMQSLLPISSQAFFTLSSRIYESVPEPDKTFRRFFAKNAPTQLTDAPEAELVPFVRGGGEMVEDMVFALRSYAIAQEFKRPRRVRSPFPLI